MEIERKYLIPQLPKHVEDFPSCLIEQAYLCTDPVVRIRRAGDDYYLTYRIPLPGSDHLVIELDVFSGTYQGLVLAEVEFSSMEEAMAFTPPDWFGEDVTMSGKYQNSRLANPDHNP